MHVILNQKEDHSVVKVMPVKCRNRYFDEGRLYISRKIRRRLGRYERVPRLMETLTYDNKKMGKQEAWASFGKDTRRFLNAINQYPKRRGWQRLHYLWVVEVQKGTGYPHVHIFFPNLRWLAPLSIINGNWQKGRANIESPKKIKVNCAAYISKYLRKMRGWSDIHLALLWSGHSRMYGFSRGFSVNFEIKESVWQRWHVIETDSLEALENPLENGGYTVERSEKRRGKEVKDDWKPVRKGGFPGGVRRTVRDRNGVPWHYDHNLKQWVKGMWSSKAALKPGKRVDKNGFEDDRESGK